MYLKTACGFAFTFSHTQCHTHSVTLNEAYGITLMIIHYTSAGLGPVYTDRLCLSVVIWWALYFKARSHVPVKSAVLLVASLILLMLCVNKNAFQLDAYRPQQ